MVTFRDFEVEFGPHKGGLNFQRRVVDLSRPNPSNNARIAFVIKSFDIGYSRSDRNLKRVILLPQIESFGDFKTTVTIGVTMGLRDNSGNWDDKFEGKAKIGVIVIDDEQINLEFGGHSFSNIRGQGPARRTRLIQLNNRGQNSAVYMSGFDVYFEDYDRNVKEITAGVQNRNIGYSGVNFDAIDAHLGLRDSSGFYDDSYGGTVFYTGFYFPRTRYQMDEGRLSIAGVNEGPKHISTFHLIPGAYHEEQICVGLREFQLGYSGGDRNLFRMTAGVALDKIRRDPHGISVVTVGFEGGIRDSSGHWDDQYIAGGSYTILTTPN